MTPAAAERRAVERDSAPRERTSGHGGTSSCIGPASPELTAERVSLRLMGDDDYPVEEMRALGPSVLPALIEIARDGKDEYVRDRAISILGDLGCRDAADAVEPLLRDADEGVRMYAVIALAKLLGAEATPALVAMLGDSDASGVLKYTVRSLGEVGDARAIEPLTEFRRSTPHDWLRRFADDAIAQIRGRG